MSTNPIGSFSGDYGPDSFSDEPAPLGNDPSPAAAQEIPVGEADASPESQQARPNLSDLPLELQEAIVNQIQDRGDVDSLSRTSRVLHHATQPRRDFERAAKDALNKYGVLDQVKQYGSGTLQQVDAARVVHEIHERLVMKCKPDELRAVIRAKRLDVNAVSNAGTALSALISRAGKDNKEDDILEKIKILLDAGADPNLQKMGSANHQCNLVQALDKAESYPELFSLLLKAKANPDGWDARSGTPLTFAIKKDNEEAVRLLLVSGADPERAVLGPTPLAVIEKKLKGTSDMAQKQTYEKIRGMLEEAIREKKTGKNVANRV